MLFLKNKFVILLTLMFCISNSLAVSTHQTTNIMLPQQNAAKDAGQTQPCMDLRKVFLNAVLKPFNRISIAIPGNFTVQEGPEFTVRLFVSSKYKNVFKYIQIIEKDGSLMIRFGERLEKGQTPNFIGVITMPGKIQLKELSLWDHGILNCLNDIDTDSLNVILIDHSSALLMGRADMHTVCIGRKSVYNAKGIIAKETKGTVISNSYAVFGVPGKIDDLKKDSESVISVLSSKKE
jgi:hypothetical protein